MRIQTVTAGNGGGPRLQAFDGTAAMPVGLAPPTTAAGVGGDVFLPLLGKGTVLGGVYKGGTYLISEVDGATPLQIASQLQKYNIVNDPGMAQAQAKQLLDIAQSKGSNALMLGVVAGAWVGVGVHLLRPEWPLWSKALIGAIVGVLVASGLYFGFRDKPREPAAVVASPRS